ncbi:MAG: site-specific DNA-methyltransferase [Sulfurimonas sp.]|nr:site-specific DNA-methyltransferase [Sulfurimonas sp.]
MLNTIINGDCIETLKNIPDNSVDLIFADPPYFMQTEGTLLRTEGTAFKGVDDEWDKFSDYEEYDSFCTAWLKECYRILKKDGSIWVIGAFQNIYRIGYIMQNLGYWILNDIVWNKTNPTPNFKGTRFTNANETMLWCTKSKNAKYTFNYKTMKHLNNSKQMKSVWNIGLCIGNERLKDGNGDKVHSTQKPQKLLMNVILSSSKVGDIILDPFMGSGTTGAVAKETGRNFIGIERDKKYICYADERIANIKTQTDNHIFNNSLDIKPPKVGVDILLKNGYLDIGETFYDKNEKNAKTLTNKGHLSDPDNELSIHKMSATILQKSNNNGWDYWFVKRDDKLISIDNLRNKYRKEHLNYNAIYSLPQIIL